MARPIWKGSISFGLVNIPVALVPATREKALHFRLLDRKDLTPIHYKRVNEKTGREVPWEETVKGYEHEKGDFVVLTDADFRRANVEATQTVDILDFVDRAEIEPSHYEEPYFLEPLKNGRKAYVLLREALRKSNKAGIAKLVLRTKQHLAMVVPLGPVLLVEMLRYQDEIRDPKELDLPGTSLAKEGVTAKELALAEKLVEGMSSEWQPEKYRDEYRDDLMALIEKKVEAGETRSIDESEPKTERPKGGKVVDLMSLLEKSLDAKAGARKGPKAVERPRRAEEHTHRVRRPAHRSESTTRKSA